MITPHNSLHPACSDEFWASQYKKGTGILESGTEPPNWLGLEHLAYEARLRQLDLFSLEKERLRGDLIAVCSYLMEECEEENATRFLEVHSDRMGDNRLSLKCIKF